MKIFADHHMHTPLCKHATGPMEDYIERGIELGLRAVGFADHNPLPNGRGADVRMAESELDGYVQKVLDLQYRYRGKIEVLLGLEMDYVEGLEPYLEKQVARYPWDYVIGGIHYLDADCRVTSWPRKFKGDVAWLYGRYFELMRKMVRSGLCDIVAHFDVPKRSGCPPAEAQAEDITQTLQEIARARVCMEINTSGYRHAELREPEPYPSAAIVEQAMALGVTLMVNSDAHAPDQVGFRFAEVEGFLRWKGCARLAGFRQRKREWLEPETAVTAVA
ncbi:MAG: histidinol-phosphatase [Verrucomicrobia bacterium]|nr:histidinol-phosphatase [Verrucomicrobiota bacterium]